MRSRRRFHLLLLCVTLSVAGCAEQDETGHVNYPARPVKIVVPFGAGGGSDTFARIVQKAVEDHNLFPQPLVVINVPGAGGNVGSRRVKNARPDGYTILMWHDGILTNQHSGQSAYGPEAFDLIAGTGEVGLVITVPEDSPYQNLQELLEEAVERPEEVVFAANIGAPVHFAGLMLEHAEPGARFRYVQSGDGAKRFASLIGGHAEVSAFSVAEYLQFREGGIRALALCAKQRHPVADVPTAREQGYDVISSNMQFWFAPRGTDPEKVRVFADLLERVMQTPEVREQLRKLSIDPVFVEEDAYRAEIADREERISEVSARPTTELPDYPLWAGGLVLFLGSIVGVQTFRERQHRPATETAIEPEKWGLLSLIVLLTIVYVVCLQAEILGYRPATFLFVLGSGGLLARKRRKLLPIVLLLAILLSWGLHFVMTQLFVIDLP